MTATYYHKPSDFKIGQEFFGAVNYTRFRIVNIYRAAKRSSKLKTYVDYQNIATKKIYCTDLDTFCRCNIEIIDR